jgi:hypothetical protein
MTICFTILSSCIKKKYDCVCYTTTIESNSTFRSGTKESFDIHEVEIEGPKAKAQKECESKNFNISKLNRLQKTECHLR